MKKDNKNPHKSIVIHKDKVEFQNHNFRITITPTEERDINGCIARAMEHAANANLTGLTVLDRRVEQ